MDQEGSVPSNVNDDKEKFSDSSDGPKVNEGR